MRKERSVNRPVPSSAPKSAPPSPHRRRRRHPRYRANFAVNVVLFTDNIYQKLDGHCLDLSEAGMGILMAAELNNGEVASLSFSPPNSGPWELRAVVRHRRGYQYGFEFLSLTEEQKKQLASHVEKLERAD
ncbi:MAG: PilZ domain-containing protein [Candidatus Sulfotelmatobacter sp.]